MQKYMWTILLVLITAAALLAGCKKAGVVEEQQEPAPQQRADIPVPPGMPPGAGAPAAPAPQRSIEAVDVAAKWKGVEITVTEKEGEAKSYTVEIPFDGEAAVEGTPLSIKLLGFVPDFAMGADTITTKSLEDVNPAAKIEISEEGTVLFTGWSFRDFPGMHSFDDPRYAVTMSRAIPAE